MQYNSIQHNTLPYHTIYQNIEYDVKCEQKYITIQYNTTQYMTIPYHTDHRIRRKMQAEMQYNTIQYNRKMRETIGNRMEPVGNRKPITGILRKSVAETTWNA